MKYTNEIKIGVFAISGLILLIFGWAFLREFAVHSQQKFIVTFGDVAGLTKGSFVRINGLRVGRVDSLTLDTKQNKVLVEARIQLPNIKIPNDSMIYIRTSGYVGDKYLDIVLGMSINFIKENDLVNGEVVIDAFQSLETVSKILNELDPEIVGKSIQDVTQQAAGLVKKVDVVVESANKLVKSIPQGMDFVDLIDKAHETVSNLNIAIEKAQSLAVNETAHNNLSKLLSQASVISSDLSETIKNANNLANNTEAFDNINSLLVKASKIIEQLDEIRADPLIQNELRETLQNTNVAAKKVSRTSDELSDALHKRFLLPRLWFGKLLPKKGEEQAE